MNLIVAIDKKRGIGLDNKIPWHFKDDLRYFKKITLNSVVIMGRNTWESLPSAYKPLEKRYNIVVSTTKQTKDGEDFLAKSFEEALKHSKTIKTPIFIIGGSRLYKETLCHPECEKVFITYVNGNYNCDVFFPNLPSHYMLKSFEKIGKLTFTMYERTTQEHPEKLYVKALSNIINNGNSRNDRTKIGTKSLFGMQFRYPLLDSFPLLTTKRMYWKGILGELLWFLKGSTNIQELRDKKIHIWDGNSTREYLDSIGLKDRAEFDGGPIYGFNFRHYGAKYVDCHTDYSSQGYDQVKDCLRLIKEKPHSRRILINLWNPNELKNMVLPPCHLLYQFYVDGNKLSCSMYQRSGDMGLGVPFNIASASLMTYIFAKLTGLEPYELVHTIGDAHVYNNHIEALKTQLDRNPRPFPKLVINSEKKYEKVEDFEASDFKIECYSCYPSIKMKMAV